MTSGVIKWDASLPQTSSAGEAEGSVSGEDTETSFDQSDLVKIHTVENRFEADLLMQALREEHIPAMLRRFEETAYDGLFVTQMGWGAILVPGDYEAEGRDLIEDVLESLRESPPDTSVEP
ncbi:MAG: hypothetical protein P8075_14090 [Deltaproteobacteria bacterium]|jgi:hypothetical protein